MGTQFDPVTTAEPLLIEQRSAEALFTQLEAGEILIIVMLKQSQHRPGATQRSPRQQTGNGHLANGTTTGKRTHLQPELEGIIGPQRFHAEGSAVSDCQLEEGVIGSTA